MPFQVGKKEHMCKIVYALPISGKTGKTATGMMPSGGGTEGRTEM